MCWVEAVELPFLCLSACRKNAENMYYFSELALTLNAWESNTAPTDSRLRPDQRLMENGRWDEANAEKQRLEEKQRLSRKKREAEAMKATEDGNAPVPCSVSQCMTSVSSDLAFHCLPF